MVNGLYTTPWFATPPIDRPQGQDVHPTHKMLHMDKIVREERKKMGVTF